MVKHLRSVVSAVSVVIACATAAQAQTPRPASKATRPVKADATLPDLVFIDAGAGYLFNSANLSETRKDPYFAETKTWTADYSVKNGPTFDIGGGVRVWHHLLCAVAYTNFSDSETAAITGEVPNPFQFNKFRSISGTSPTLTHQEQTIHLSALWRTRVSPKVEIGVFGGASFISLRRDFVSDVQFSDVYPYDAATFTQAVTAETSKSYVGFHAGADGAWFFTRHLGVSGTLRYSRATADLTTPAGNPVSLKLGGVSVNGGLRISLGGRPGESHGPVLVHKPPPRHR